MPSRYSKIHRILAATVFGITTLAGCSLLPIDQNRIANEVKAQQEALWKRGKQALDSKNYGSAESCFAAALALGKVPQLQIDYATALVSNDGAQAAVDVLNSILINNKDNVDAFYLRGSAYKKLRQYAKAQSDFATCNEKRPSEEKYILAMTESQAAQNNYYDAVDSLLRFQETYAKPAVQQRLTKYAQALLNQSEPQLSGRNANAYQRAALAFFALGKNTEAERAANTAITLSNRSDMAYQIRGRIFEAKREYAKAESDFKQATLLAPSNYNPIFNLGRIRYSLGKNEEAIDNFLHCITLKGGDIPEAHSNMGYAYCALGKFDEGLKEVSVAIEKSPTDMRFWCGRSERERTAGKLEDAIKDAKKAVEIDPSLVRPHRALAEACIDAQNWQTAEAEYQRIIELSQPPTEDDYAMLVDAFISDHKLDTAEQWITQWQKKFPNSNRPLGASIELLSARGDVDTITHKLEQNKAILNPHYIESKALYCSLVKGDMSAAAATIKNAKIARNDGSLFPLRAAFAESILGDTGSACLHAQQYFDVQSTDRARDAEAAHAYIVCSRCGQVDRGKELLRTAMNSRNGTWTRVLTRFLLGEISEADLFKAAGIDWGNQTDAHVYIGVQKLTEGKTREAKQHFEWVRDNGRKDFAEFPYVMAELKTRKF